VVLAAIPTSMTVWAFGTGLEHNKRLKAQQAQLNQIQAQLNGLQARPPLLNDQFTKTRIY
jgi:hypothetical protein